MAKQTEQPTPKTAPSQSQVESLAAFLSDWSEESVQVPMMAEEKAETEHQIHLGRLSPSPHRPAAPPAPGLPLPSGTLRRRSSLMSTASGNDEGDVFGSGNGATQPPPALPLPFTGQRRYNDNGQNGSLQHEATTNMSPSCARTYLLGERSARAGGGGIPPPPPPLLPDSRPSGHRADTVETRAVETSPISTSTSTSNRAE